MDKKTEQQTNQQSLGVVKLLGGLQNSKWNVVVVKDDPLVFLQFYMGLYLNIPTVIIIKKTERYYIKRLKHPLVKHIVEVDSLTDDDIRTAQEHVNLLLTTREKGVRKYVQK